MLKTKSMEGIMINLEECEKDVENILDSCRRQANEKNETKREICLYSTEEEIFQLFADL